VAEGNLEKEGKRTQRSNSKKKVIAGKAWSSLVIEMFSPWVPCKTKLGRAYTIGWKESLKTKNIASKEKMAKKSGRLDKQRPVFGGGVVKEKQKGLRRSIGRTDLASEDDEHARHSKNWTRNNKCTLDLSVLIVPVFRGEGKHVPIEGKREAPSGLLERGRAGRVVTTRDVRRRGGGEVRQNFSAGGELGASK